MDRKIRSIISVFPNVAHDPKFKITSPKDPDYNCIAWSMNKKDVWIWPNVSDHSEGFVWFEGVAHNRLPETFIKAFEKNGFEVCNSPLLEDGYDKVALYVDYEGLISHAARQLSNGMWTSKLGWWEDIQHSSPQTLEGDFYGKVHCYMKRQKDTKYLHELNN